MVQVSGAGLGPSQRQVAAATVGRRPRTGSPATGFGRRRRRCVNSFFFFPCLLLCCCGYRLLVRREKTGETPGGGATSGRGGGQGHPYLDGRRVEDRVANWRAGGCRTGSQWPWTDRKATGHDRRRAKVRVALCFQGHLSVPPPSGCCSQTKGTRWVALGALERSVVLAAERRPAGGGLVGRRRRRRRGGTAVQALAGSVWSVGGHDGSLCDLVLAAVGWDVGEGWTAIQTATLSCGFSKTSFLTLSISTSTRRQGHDHLYTGGPGGVEMCP
jgi:hypothetical protein